MVRPPHSELHRTSRIGWLRAAVLGANDGIVSTASLLAGVAAASVGRAELIQTGIAGLVAGALSMAAGEYVSVSSQADTEHADLERERAELAADPVHEHDELASIYVGRGLPRALAEEVAAQLMAHDALGAHARDELGMSETVAARPVQASVASAASFAVGAALPLAVTLLSPMGAVVPVVIGASVASLVALGAVSARTGGAPVVKATLRVALLGGGAMAMTALVGRLFGAVV